MAAASEISQLRKSNSIRFLLFLKPSAIFLTPSNDIFMSFILTQPLII